MVVVTRPELRLLVADKAKLRKILEEQDKETGFVVDRTITAEQVQAMMLADGIRPEDNVGSREIMRMREE